MRLIDQLAKDYQTVSLVGMVKNAGKTTLLNELIDQAFLSEIVLGLTTIGHDGEKIDQVTSTPKPLIDVNKGTLVATAKAMLEKSNLHFEVLEVTDFQTAFGPIVIVKMQEQCQIELMGPRSSKGVLEVSRLMINWGARIVLIDGALDRVSSASPAVADGVFLSTGAALSRDMNQVVKQTAHRVKLFQLESINQYRTEFKRLKEENQIAVIDKEGNIDRIDLKTGINAGKNLSQHLNDDSRYLFIPGALTYMTVKLLLDYFTGHIEIIVTDGSKIFISRDNYHHLLSKGLTIKVLDCINLIGISVNPVSQKGYYFDGEKLIGLLKSQVGGLPIINVYES